MGIDRGARVEVTAGTHMGEGVRLKGRSQAQKAETEHRQQVCGTPNILGGRDRTQREET